MEEQVMAAILRPIMYLLHIRPVFGITEEVFSVLVLRVWEDIPNKIDSKLLPKHSNILFRGCFTDGDLVFHFSPPIILLEGYEA